MLERHVVRLTMTNTRKAVLAIVCLAVLAGLAFTPPGRGILARLHHAVACGSSLGCE